MIRTFQQIDTEPVMQIWLNGNIEAHGFVPQTYWLSNYAAVRDQLMQAEIFVYTEEERICGFIGIIEGYIAGIFVDAEYRSKGIGGSLLQYAKTRYASLSLSVYQKNRRAVGFYFRQGFSVLSQGVDEDTNETEYTMTWGEQNT